MSGRVARKTCIGQLACRSGSLLQPVCTLRESGQQACGLLNVIWRKHDSRASFPQQTGRLITRMMSLESPTQTFKQSM